MKSHCMGSHLEVERPDDAALVFVVALHVEVAVVCNGEDMRRHFPNLLVGVEADLIGRVDGEQLVGVHCHQDGAGVRLQEAQTHCAVKQTRHLLSHLQF